MTLFRFLRPSPPNRYGAAPLLLALPQSWSRVTPRLLRLLRMQVGGQAVLGRQDASPTPWLTERHGYDPTWEVSECDSVSLPQTIAT